ncbi:hypothetical protein E2C01_077149 [Portunus trituberculatus]|uniref:Uncharacterized protein n=1 Tax=Portunus trituberculatus TaxID=210409 RepID=A0A5B7IDM2_PORTR|nr:hypothetical protein [Portunus trituberculatus]
MYRCVGLVTRLLLFMRDAFNASQTLRSTLATYSVPHPDQVAAAPKLANHRHAYDSAVQPMTPESWTSDGVSCLLPRARPPSSGRQRSPKDTDKLARRRWSWGLGKKSDAPSNTPHSPASGFYVVRCRVFWPCLRRCPAGRMRQRCHTDAGKEMSGAGWSPR